MAGHGSFPFVKISRSKGKGLTFGDGFSHAHHCELPAKSNDAGRPSLRSFNVRQRLFFDEISDAVGCLIEQGQCVLELAGAASPLDAVQAS